MIPKKIKIWLLAARAETLFISICSIMIGVFLASLEVKLNIPILILTFLYGLFAHIGTNLSNDYFDYLKGADTENRIAPLSTIQNKLTSLKEVKIVYSTAFFLALLIGIIFIFRGGIIVFLMFSFPIIFGFLYTGGPYPLGYLGFGDLLVFIFLGPFSVLGTYFLQTLKFSYLPIIASLGTGFLSVAILTINNLRDLETDKIVNKNTLAVRFGKKFVQMEFIMSIILVFLSTYLSYLYLKKPLILSSLIIIFFVPFKLIFNFKNPKFLNDSMKKIAILQIIYTILFCISLVL
jgi:1,4-dihydroxy-2-naphthoate octaprenyltransferase